MIFKGVRFSVVPKKKKTYATPIFKKKIYGKTANFLHKKSGNYKSFVVRTANWQKKTKQKKNSFITSQIEQIYTLPQYLNITLIIIY